MIHLLSGRSGIKGGMEHTVERFEMDVEAVEVVEQVVKRRLTGTGHGPFARACPFIRFIPFVYYSSVSNTNLSCLIIIDLLHLM